MGKPAARIGDTTAHGGTIVSGAPTVLIGGRPAACVGDAHACPMQPAHVGGPILPPGAPTVLIGGRPAARVGDQALCAGPPDVIAVGELTVLIGEAGGGGGAAGGAGGQPALYEPGGEVVGPGDDLEVLDKDKGQLTYAPLAGTLFVDGVSASDVMQQYIGDCYLMAAMAAVAHARPDIIEGMFIGGTAPPTIAQGLAGMIGRGTATEVTVIFKQSTPTGAMDVPVTVDTSVPMKRGSPQYGKSTQPGETWPAILEKGYAAAFGAGRGYEGIGHGGSVGNALTRISGGTSQYTPISKPLAAADPSYADGLYAKLEGAQLARKPTCAATGSDTQRYQGSMVHANHAYTVTGVRQDQSGQKWVEIRNPWGDRTDPTGETFQMPLEHFIRDFDDLHICTPA